MQTKISASDISLVHTDYLSLLSIEGEFRVTTHFQFSSFIVLGDLVSITLTYIFRDLFTAKFTLYW